MTVSETVRCLTERGQTVTTAESCTGGLIAYTITSVAGASQCYNEGYVTYAVDAKERLLGVHGEVIREHGVVSAECAAAMAEGALSAAKADYALATTGIAGPTGGDDEHPVGLVYIACAYSDGTDTERFVFSGDRGEVQRQAADAAIALLSDMILRTK